jgi:hypothetical protein
MLAWLNYKPASFFDFSSRATLSFTLALSSHSSISAIEVGPGDRRSHRNSALGFCFLSMNQKLCDCRQHDLTAIPQRLVSFSAHPQPVQQNS